MLQTDDTMGFIPGICDKICVLSLLLKKSIVIINLSLFRWRRRRWHDYRISSLFSFQTAMRVLVLLRLAYWPN